MPLNFLRPFGFICKFPPLAIVGLYTISCIYVVSISEFPLHPCASQQLPAFMRSQYLSFPPSSQQLLALILFRRLTSPLPPASLTNFCITWLQYLHIPLFLSTSSCMKPFSMSKFPLPLCLSAASCIHLVHIPLHLSTFVLACIVMYLHLVSMSRV